MRAVPRERIVMADIAEFTYQNCSLPIAEGQTIPQPYIVVHTRARLYAQRQQAR